MISVIIPIYNVEPYLHQCLESVVNQTYTDIEIILVEDCSEDNPLPIINHFNDDRIILIRNERNLGLAPSRNKAMKIAKGEWLFFLDSDDYISTDCLETLFYAITDEMIISGNFKAFTNAKTKLCHFRTNRLNNFARQTIEKIYIDEYNFILWTVWGKLYNRKFLLDNNIWFIDENVTYEDYSFNKKCLFHKPKVKQLIKTCVYYRIREDSITGKDNFKGFGEDTKEYQKAMNDIEIYKSSFK